MDGQYTLLFPWQTGNIYPKKRAKPSKTRQNCEEWACKWPGCPTMLNDVETKNRRRIYCPTHHQLLRSSRKSYAQMVEEAERLKQK